MTQHFRNLIDEFSIFSTRPSFDDGLDHDELMFIHIREPEEIERAVDAFGAQTLLIKRANLDNIASNYSDANVDQYHYDFVIYNATLESLESDAR